jgi:hypothetical protein
MGAQCTEHIEKRILLGIQCIECVSMGWNTHTLYDMHRGKKNLSEIILLQLKNLILTGNVGLVLVPARQMD